MKEAELLQTTLTQCSAASAQRSDGSGHWR